MKTITVLLVAVAASFSINANADNLYSDPGIGDVFPMNDVSYQANEVSYVKETGKEVWSIEYEEWVNPGDFNSTAKLTVADILQELETNPPAAGSIRSDSVFIWDEVADEYQLQ
jgi:hypothetical protein